MQTMDDMALLREYSVNRSDQAFSELVSRRIHFVHSAALRQVRDPHLAEEVTQTVFVILAQKAGKISDKTVLAGWLFKTTRFAALAQMRSEAKRRHNELEAQMQQPESQSSSPDEIWEQMSPHLDEALGVLGEKDRQAVLLRFFEDKSLADVGTTLNMGEDTARKRVARALEKLRKFFARRGVVSTTAIIAGVISANSVHAAPAGLAATVAATAAKGSAASASTLTLVKGTFKLMTYAKLKLSLGIAAALLLTAGTVNVAISSMTRADGDLVGEASPQETSFANELIRATADEDYDAFVADGDKNLKSLSKRQFKAVCDQVTDQMKGGYRVIFLGSFHLKSVSDHVTLWKISYNDGSDDDVLHLSVDNGKITGALLLSPLE